jgi:mannose-6-phosphate isomerase-like protein (cupin superfamily)
VKGWVRFEYEDIGEVTLTAGTSVLQPPRIRHREIAHSDDLELVEITAPASFETKLVEAP